MSAAIAHGPVVVADLSAPTSPPAILNAWVVSVIGGIHVAQTRPTRSHAPVSLGYLVHHSSVSLEVTTNLLRWDTHAETPVRGRARPDELCAVVPRDFPSARGH